MLAWRWSNKNATCCHNNYTNIYTLLSCLKLRSKRFLSFDLQLITFLSSCYLMLSIVSYGNPHQKQITIWPHRDMFIYKDKLPLYSDGNHASNLTGSPFGVNKTAIRKHYSILWQKYSLIFLISLYKCLNSSFNWSPSTNAKSNLLETEKFWSLEFPL